MHLSIPNYMEQQDIMQALKGSLCCSSYFFTEPDEALVQQSTLLQHNQLYGLNKHGEVEQQ